MSLADALTAVGAAFLVAGILARLGRRAGLPTIPLFVLAGIALGPNTPGIVLFEDAADLELLAALGLIFLLFYIGLEFSLDELTAGGRSLPLAGAAYLLLNVGGGLLFGLALGWGTEEALVLAGVLGISSSAIVSKVLVELGRLRRPESPLILGVIVIEDIFLALYLALLAPILGGAETPAEAAADIAVALAVLLTLAAIARYAARAVGRLLAAPDDELFLVCLIGVAVLVAGLSQELGVKYAIGALMAGIIVGSTTSRERAVRLLAPLRDTFGALFFFAFGLTVAPADVGSVLLPVLAAVTLTVTLNVVAGVLAARIRGLGGDEAAAIGFTLVARGEFALVLATLAVAAGLDERITAFVAGYVLVLAVLGPLAAQHSAELARLLPGTHRVAKTA